MSQFDRIADIEYALINNFIKVNNDLCRFVGKESSLLLIVLQFISICLSCLTLNVLFWMWYTHCRLSAVRNSGKLWGIFVNHQKEFPIFLLPAGNHHWWTNELSSSDKSRDQTQSRDCSGQGCSPPLWPGILEYDPSGLGGSLDWRWRTAAKNIEKRGAYSTFFMLPLINFRSMCSWMGNSGWAVLAFALLLGGDHVEGFFFGCR